MSKKLTLTERQLRALFADVRTFVLLQSRAPVAQSREIEWYTAETQPPVSDETHLTVAETRDMYERLKEYLFPYLPEEHEHEVSREAGA